MGDAWVIDTDGFFPYNRGTSTRKKGRREETVVLQRITKKCRDRSTERFFKFSFYCDACGKEWISESYHFEHAFPSEMSEGEKQAREIMWRTDHDAAFERANLEARLRLSRCSRCGRCVCDECFSLEEDLCTHCAEGAKAPCKSGEGIA